MSLEPGTELGPYKIDGLLGAGGMGEVYHARDGRLGRRVAVKVIPAIFATDHERLRRFEQEARAAAALNHPGVLAVYDVGVHQGAPYLVTELLEGVSLRDKLNAEHLSIQKAIDYGGQIALALAAAHDKGIVHRDIKPDNLFITTADRVKILDFGLAKLTARELDADGTIAERTGSGAGAVGTIGYMAPEQARGQSADHRADVFAFGCVLFEMLQGRRAFGRDTPADTLSAILSDPAPVLTSSVEQPLPPAVHDIVRRCLEKDPASRFQSTRGLAFALTTLTGQTSSVVGLDRGEGTDRTGPAVAGFALDGVQLRRVRPFGGIRLARSCRRAALAAVHGRGRATLWRADDREMYYLGLDAGLYAVEIREEGAELKASQPRLLFRTTLPVISAVVEQYRATADGGRFLFCTTLTSPQREPLRMLVNWQAKLARTR